MTKGVQAPPPKFFPSNSFKRWVTGPLRTRLQGKEVLEKIILVLENYFTEKKKPNY